MVVGIIDHATGTRDIRRLAWLGRPQPAAAGHRRAAHGQHGGAAAVLRLRRQGGRLRDRCCTARHWALPRRVVLAGVVAGSVFTTIYSLRFLWGAFARKGRAEPEQPGGRHAPPAGHVPRSRPAILAAAGLLFGLWPAAPGHRARTTTPTRCPAATRLPPGAVARSRPAAAAVGGGAGRRHRRVLAPGAAAPNAGGLPAAGQRRPHLRRGASAAPTCCRCG